MIPRCLSCRQPMKLDFVSKKVHKTKEGKYTVKKYKCELCGTSECIYADGARDIYFDPMNAKNESKELQNQLYTGELTDADKEFLGLEDSDLFDCPYDED